MRFLSTTVIALFLIALAYQQVLIGSLQNRITSFEEQSAISKTAAEYRSDYYNSEAATLQSPHGLRLKIDEGNDSFILVDVRRNDFYQEGHIVGALNIATDRSEAEVLADFQTLKDENPSKELIIYCYSTSCLNGRKVGRFLANNGIYVKELSIGYNEWIQTPEIWNYPGEEYNIEDYIVTGKEPGVFDPITPARNTSCGSEAFAC